MVLKSFLILTYTPYEDITSDNSINNLLSLKYKLQSLNWVHSVITLLDIPLLDNSDLPLQERLENFKTLKDENIDKERGFKEILNSPVFRNFVISEDGKTSGIIVNIKRDDKFKDIKNKSKKEIEEIKDKIKKQNHQNILEIRDVIESYQNIGKIYLGGIPMIANDMMSFIKSDIIIFGIAVLAFIVVTLWFIFKKIIWIIVPISSCFFSVLNNDGFNWFIRLESNCYIVKLHCFDVNFNYGNEYSHGYEIFTTKTE